MSNIKVNVQSVINAGGKAVKSAGIIDTTKNNLNNVRNSLDSKILSRNNISGQFLEINLELQKISSKINRIKSVTDINVAEYEKTDNAISRKIKNINVSKLK